MDPRLLGHYETELRYLRDHEWAMRAEDVLWRRSKLGLHIDPASLADVSRRIDRWLASAAASPPSPPSPRTVA